MTIRSIFGWERTRCGALALLAAGGPTACGPTEKTEEADAPTRIATAEQPIRAGTDVDAALCDSDQRTAIRHMAVIARTMAASTAFAECVNARLDTNTYRACVQDPDRGQSHDVAFGKLLTAARSDNPLRVNCEANCGGDGCSATGQFGHAGFEEVDISGGVATEAHGWVTSSPQNVGFLGEPAGLLAHEALHQQGYSHDPQGSDCVLGRPYLVGGCVKEVWSIGRDHCDPDFCKGAARIAVPGAGQVAWSDFVGGTMNGSECECVRDPAASSDPTLDEPATPVLGTNDTGDHFGAALCTGDFDGDGFDDLAVGAPGDHQSTGSIGGALYLYRGTALGPYPWRRLAPLLVGTEFGFSCASTDLDGDGKAELAIGVPGVSGPGSVLLYRGTEDGPQTAAEVLGATDSPAAGDRFGYALKAGFDGFNPWIAASAPRHFVDGVQSGAVYVFVGPGVIRTDGALISERFRVTQAPLDTNAAGDFFGNSLGAGRIDGGHADALVVGAPGDDKAFVFNGHSLVVDPSWGPQTVLASPDTLSLNFAAALSVGTFTNSIQGSIAVGTPDRRRVDIFDRFGTLEQSIVHGGLDFDFGASVLAMNIDTTQGFSDLVVGSPGGGLQVAQYFLGAFGAVSEPPTVLDQSGFGTNDLGKFGAALAVGDFNGDRIEDLVVGAPAESPPGSLEAGAIFLFTAKPDPTPRVLVPWKEFDQEEQLGGGGSGLAEAPWAALGGSSRHLGQSRYLGPRTATLARSFSISADIRSSVAVGIDRAVYFGGQDNKIHALKADGTAKWPAVATGGNVDSSPAIGANGLLYVGSSDNKLYAVDVDDGHVAWTYGTGGTVRSSPAIAKDGTIVFGSFDQRIYAVNPDGTLKWRFKADGLIDSSPAIGGDGTIYIGADDYLYALLPAAGLSDAARLRWRTHLGGDVHSSPAIAPTPAGTIYVGSDSDYLNAVRPSDGAVLWRVKTSPDLDVASSPAIGIDGTVYFGSDNNKVQAVSPAGATLWTYATGGDVKSSPTLGADGTIYIGSDDDYVYALRPGTGLTEGARLLWRASLGGDVRATPSIGPDGSLFIGSDGNKLSTFKDP